MKKHKNSQKRRLFDHGEYFITTNTKNRYPYFQEEVLCELFIKELQIVKQIKDFNLFGFCILPDHIHLLLKVTLGSDLPEIMRSLKTNFSRNANLLIEGNVTSRRLQFKNNNLHDYLSFLSVLQNKLKKASIPKFAWQKSYHDHYIRNKKDFTNHLFYLQNNHLKHDLPANWRYVSYNYMSMIDF